MNMDTLGKLTAPATAKIRQLQKIVQDIRKNDGSLLNKLRRLKSKPLPKVPARDYRDNDGECDEQLSEAEYDKDTYENPQEQDDNYEPPPSHRVFTTTPSASFPGGEYLGSCSNRPDQPPRKPFHLAKSTKPLPPEPAQLGSDGEDYINPDGGNDDNNYIEPTEKPPANPVMYGGIRVMMDHPILFAPLPERPPSPDFYEVSDKGENTLAASRLSPISITPSHSVPPIPNPRMNMKRSSTPIPEPTGNDEYEVCDPNENSCTKSTQNPPHIPPKPLPRERSPKPDLRPKPDLKQRESESRTLPVILSDKKLPVKAHTWDLKRPQIRLPHSFTSPRQTDRGNVSVENGLIDLQKEADVYNKPWYASACDRKTADDILTQANKDGAFLVRKSSGHDTQQPYTLAVFYNDKVYNIPIRFIQMTQQYALGKEKKGEEYFTSVSHIIENHQRIPLVLIDTQSNSKDATKLCYPMRP
ncbi:hypothetical protein LDENG_00046180 [Lucifuga dentata]|nr:hypothetical protein LDENG_00046180 [Lucifuga dentata]